MALLLALARNIPQAHASLTSGKWERSKFSGTELCEKTLGILGFGRIGQLVAQRARGFQMRVVAYDPYVGEERYRELGVEKAETPEDVYAVADFLTVHLPKTPDTEGWMNAERARASARTACACSTSPAVRWSSTRICRRRSTPARSAARRSTCSAPSRSPSTRCSAIRT